jgi:flavin-dependent amine oxidoreductase
MTDGPRITIAGGGLAGLTAGLRLAERGYSVKVYEQKSMLGGNLGSRRERDGDHLDVYPHMYLDWYHNFWALLDDVTEVNRVQMFEPFSTVKQLSKGEFPKFAALTDMYSPWHTMQNLFSGVGPPADMFLFGYAGIDLLAERLNPTMRLSNVDVNAFMNARPYMTKRTAEAYDSFITRVWAIPSYLAAARDFRHYLQYSLADPKPAYWLPRGSAIRQVIGPLSTALKARGVEIVTKVQVTSVSVTDGRVTDIGLQDTKFDPRTYMWLGIDGTQRTEPVEDLVLAVPAAALSTLVRTSGGLTSHSVVQAAPDIAGIVRLRAQQVPIIHLYFNQKLQGIPPEPVGLFGSSLALAFTDISQTWQGEPGFADRTVLAVSSSDTTGLPGTAPLDDAHAMLVELAEFLSFDPGKQWGDSPQIDWVRTRYDTNADAQLFVNETGTDAWRPKAASAHISNIFMAGDFCHSHVGMTTIESAVTTGLQAAQAVVERRGLGTPVEIVKPDHSIVSDAMYVWLRYAWAPYAAAASAWSHGSDVVTRVADEVGKVRSALGRLMAPASAAPPPRGRYPGSAPAGTPPATAKPRTNPAPPAAPAAPATPPPVTPAPPDPKRAPAPRTQRRDS